MHRNAKRSFFVYLFFVWSGLHASTWREIIESKRTLMGTAYDVIGNQLHAYETHVSPKIADPAIKEIPIYDSHEPLVDCNTMAHPRVVMLPTPSTPFESPNHNSGFPSASRMRQGVYERLVMMLVELDALAYDFGYEPGQVAIRVFEGLRDIHTQTMLFNNKVQEILGLNVHMTQEQAISEASKWVSPVQNNIPVHATGAAVDICLWDSYNNVAIDAGQLGVIWGPNEGAPTFSVHTTATQKLNRLYLLIAANKVGLINYGYEHWHFSYGDRYAAYWSAQTKENRYACYGLADLP